MVKYSSFILIASICVFTVLCISAATVSAANLQAERDVDYFKGDLAVFFKAFSDFSGSDNGFVKFLREHVEKCLASFDENKKEIQDAVKEGTEMEKKIQDILTTLKNFTIPLPKELQSEIDTIGETAAAELTKLKGMDKVEDIEAMKTKYKTHYETIRKQIEDLSKIAATSPPVNPEAAVKAAPVTQTVPKSIQRSLAVAQAEVVAEGQAANAEAAKEKEMETKLFELMKTALPVLRSAEADEETISGKFRNVYTTVSKIRNELIKAERIQFHLLRSQNQFKTDAAPSVRSSLVQFAIAIMFGMLF